MKVPQIEQNQSKLVEWGLEIMMKRTLNKFEVINCTTGANKDGVYLAIGLQRLSSPFWMSLFVPSICLILAAEVAVFIDEAHFEAMIMVSLTSNLVMYTLYSGIQDKLPEDASLKLIDLWLLHGLLMPMVVFVVLAANELVKTRKSSHEISTKGTKVANFAVQEKAKIHEDFEGPEKKNSGCMMACKVIIPTVSFIFIATFFLICLRDLSIIR